MKTCSICRQPKELDQFHKNKAQPDGHNHRCKACRNQVRTNAEMEMQAERVRRYVAKHGRAEIRRRRKRDAPEKWRAQRSREKKSQAGRLSDGYVRSLIRKQDGPIPEIPQELVNAKRAVMRIERLLKERQT
jgi:hypothetical protein